MADKQRVFSNSAKYKSKLKFNRTKCPQCKTIFLLSKGIHTSSGSKNNVYCSLKCVPLNDKDIEILNCSVCSKLVENDSIFCELCFCWVHKHCSRLSDEDLTQLHSEDNNWICYM